MLGNREDALDATQEALIAVARGFVAFDGRSASKAATPRENATSPGAASSAGAARGTRDLGDLGDVSDTRAPRHRGRPVLVLVLPASGDRSTVVLLSTPACRAVAVSDLS
jgi:hypothetical protein